MAARKITHVRGLGGSPADALSYFQAANTPGDLRGSAAGFQAHVLCRPNNTSPDTDENFLAGCFDASGGVGMEIGYEMYYDRGSSAFVIRIGNGAASTSMTFDVSGALQGIDNLLSLYFDPNLAVTEATMYLNGKRVFAAMGAAFAPAAAPIQFSIGGHDPAATMSGVDGAQQTLVSAFALAGLFPAAATIEAVDVAMNDLFNRVLTAQDIPQETVVGANPLHLFSAAQSLPNLVDSPATPETWADRGSSTPAPLTRVGGSLTGASVEANWSNWQTFSSGGA